MLTRLTLGVAGIIALGVGQPGGASPITYAFAGTLSTPSSGTDQFSGSFTINGDPTIFSSDQRAFRGLGVYEHGSDVSLTVKVGGQVFNFSNQQGPNPIASFDAGLAYSWNDNQPPQDEAIISGSTSMVNGVPGVSFAMSFYSDAAADQLGNLRDFSFPIGSSSVFMNFPSVYGIGANLTSIELVPTPAPEPSTLAMFAGLGVAAIVHHHRRHSQKAG